MDLAKLPHDLGQAGQDPTFEHGKAEDFFGLPENDGIATPLRKPIRIGRDRKSASAPKRKKLAAMQINPVSNASAMERLA